MPDKDRLPPIHPGEILREEFPPLLEELQNVVAEIKVVEQKLDQLKAPWSQGRMPSLN